MTEKDFANSSQSETGLYTHDENYYRERIGSDRDFMIFSYIMGYTDGTGHSIAETTKKFGITRERVRQIVSKAFRGRCCSFGSFKSYFD